MGNWLKICGIAFISVAQPAFALSCSELVLSFEKNTAILKQTESGKCAPTCITNGVVMALHALGVPVAFNPLEESRKISHRHGGERMLLHEITTATTSLYRQCPQVEARVDAFSIVSADRNPTTATSALKVLRELNEYDLLAPDSLYPIHYTIIGVRLTHATGYIGTHSFLFFGFDNHFAVLSDPRDGNGTFLADFESTTIPLPGYVREIPAPRMLPLSLSGVFDVIPTPADPVVINGVHIKVRKK